MHPLPAVWRAPARPADPITVEEAIEALEAVGHDFYVFREMTTDTVQVGVRGLGGDDLCREQGGA